MSTKANKLAIQDRLDIQEMMARYAWAIDTADMDAFLGLFTPDGVWEMMNGDRHQGREAIRKAISFFFDRPGHAGTQHHITQILLQGEGDHATSQSYYAMLRWDGETDVKSLIGLGWYADKLVKLDGEWLFQERVIRRWNGKSHPWKGRPGGVPKGNA